MTTDTYRSQRKALLNSIAAQVRELTRLSEARKATRGSGIMDATPVHERRALPAANRSGASGQSSPLESRGGALQTPSEHYVEIKAQILAAGETQMAAPKRQENVNQRLDRDARRLMAARGLPYRDALMLAAGERVITAETSTQRAVVATEGLRASIPVRPKWNPTTQTWEAARFDANTQQYNEMKRGALGKPAPTRVTFSEAKQQARELGSRLAMSEPVAAVIHDNSDLVRAAENYRADRFMRFGENVPLRQALLKVTEGRP